MDRALSAWNIEKLRMDLGTFSVKHWKLGMGPGMHFSASNIENLGMGQATQHVPTVYKKRSAEGSMLYSSLYYQRSPQYKFKGL